MKTNYRIYTDDDINQLVDFWNQNSGWDIIFRKEWERRFYHTPLGTATIVLAEEEKTGDLLGQFIFIPSLVSVKGLQVKAFRPFAPVVKKELRSALGMLTIYNHSCWHKYHLANDLLIRLLCNYNFCFFIRCFQKPAFKYFF